MTMMDVFIHICNVPQFFPAQKFFNQVYFSVWSRLYARNEIR